MKLSVACRLFSFDRRYNTNIFSSSSSSSTTTTTTTSIYMMIMMIVISIVTESREADDRGGVRAVLLQGAPV